MVNTKDGRRPSIRPAIFEDVSNGLLELLEDLGRKPHTLDKKHIDIAFLATSGTMYSLIEGDRVIGTGRLVLDQKFLNNEKVGRIYDVVINEEFRGQGLGKSLVEHIAEQAKLKGCAYCTLSCSSFNEPFYVKCGFRKALEWMRKDLGNSEEAT